MTEIKIPEFCLILLVGASGSGKSSFANHHFLPTEILSSDALRGWVSDDETSMDATQDAFEVLRFIAQKRLARMKLTVIDATNVQPEARKHLLELAQEYHAKPIALVFDMPESLCIQRNQSRTDRSIPNHAIKRQNQQLRRSINGLEHEGFRGVHIFKTPEQVAEITIAREKLYPDMKHETGAFDIIGDIHGCYDELVLLLEKLGYQVNSDTHQAFPPNQRRAIFVGDLVDRGTKSSDVLKLVMNMVNAGHAFCVVGNHDDKLLRALRGKKVNIGHGLEQTLAQLATEPTEFIEQVKTFLSGLASHYVFDGGALVVAHGGIRGDMIGRVSGAIRSFTLYGDTTGERDDYGLPVRRDWAVNYRGSAMIVYGHTPVARPQWVNNTLNIDTGCVFGGNLTALQYPEKVWVSVESLHQYAVPARPFMLDKPDLTLQHQVDDHLAIHDVLVLDDPMGKRHIETRLDGAVLIRNRNATAALEVMSRFAVNPKWLIYLPPTMSPVQTSTLPNLLEHPDQAFGYYRDMGVEQVICQEKHMGSRAIVVICKNESIAQARFGVINEGRGVIYTRTG
ncbi:MAG: polynucleotide kinase-phosphatase, partial [Anaerolineae bacterium]|nr:polynucleotide kinase-phosphatase [Anaerolineae bacterium]